MSLKTILAGACWLPCLLAGCAGGADGAAGGGLASLGGAVLEATGLRKPAPLSESQLPPRNVAIRLHASRRLNLDPQGRPMALLVKVYKLRQRAGFDQAPYAAFLSPQAEREALGADLIEAREVTLVPEQRLELNERLAREAGYLGVVALFRAPAAQSWRQAFAAADAERAGVTVGLHACALSVGAGAAGGEKSGGALRASSLVRCQ